MKEDRWFVCWAIFCLLLSLAALGVTVWAVIELVNWVTAQ